MGSKSTRFVPSNRLAQYDVVNNQGEDMGQVQTFVVDMRAGLIAFALVSFRGVLGFNDKWFALPWAALEWDTDKLRFILDMSEDVLKEAPGMDKDKWLEAIDTWQDEQDLELLDRYYTTLGYESYLGIVQETIVKRGSRKVDAKFEISKDIAGEFRFKLVAVNGETIAVSQGYNTKDNAMIGIASVRQNAADAVVEDTTVMEKQPV
jgi:uncharacterized protein YegP (UPF0339 family)/sporulation protein YlmC with PRC-barrel domain